LEWARDIIASPLVVASAEVALVAYKLLGYLGCRTPEVPAVPATALYLDPVTERDVTNASPVLVLPCSRFFESLHGYVLSRLAVHLARVNALPFRVEFMSDREGKWSDEELRNARATVFFPEDYGKMVFWEMFALGVPLFIPSMDYLTMIFANWDANDFLPHWDPHLPWNGQLPFLFAKSVGFGPVATEQWAYSLATFRASLFDGYHIPAVKQFRSLADLISKTMSLGTLNDHAADMRQFHLHIVEKALGFYRPLLHAAVASVGQSPPAPARRTSCAA
jgi:hypothetical protein